VKAGSIVFPILLAAFAGGTCARGAPGTAAPATIVRMPLPAEEDEHQPVAVPTEPENTVEVDFPWALQDWAGRGFTPDAERFAGDFVIEATRGKGRIFVTPVAAGAHRVLHVVLAGPDRTTRGIPIEFIPAPAGLAWRKVVFTSGRPIAPIQPPVSLDAQAPRTKLREPSPESELGLVRTLRLMLNTTVEGAEGIAAANPALSLKILDSEPESFGDFTLNGRFAIRDSTTDTLALCASVSNQTGRRLVFEPGSWVVRAGDRAYPVRTVDFAGELEPGASGSAFLVLARGPGGEATRLLPDNDFKMSVLLAGEANPRPVLRMPLDGFDPP
jgi:hypothetical protein